MDRTKIQVTTLAVFALLTVAVASTTLYVSGSATTDQADTVRISASAANTGGIYSVTNAITGEDYDVIAPRQLQPTANAVT